MQTLITKAYLCQWMLELNHLLQCISAKVGAQCRSKPLPGFFLCIFSSLTCLKKPVFSKWDLLWWKVPASLSLFLKSERIPVLLNEGKGPE
jgi:hypothetical protein